MPTAQERRARKRFPKKNKQRKKLTAEDIARMEFEIALDKQCVDGIRGIFGMGPLYEAEPPPRQQERFLREYVENRVPNSKMARFTPF